MQEQNQIAHLLCHERWDWLSIKTYQDSLNVGIIVALQECFWIDLGPTEILIKKQVN